jgi:hypothetical protein
MGWRDKYKRHPAADVFPMMEGKELAALVEDIKDSGGLKTPITVDKNGVLLDGRNRLEALDRAGIELHRWQVHVYPGDDPVGWIKSANAHRRHLTQQQKADAIVALAKIAVAAEQKPGHDGPVSEQTWKGGRGRKNPVKQKALEINSTLPKQDQAGERAIKRSLAKAVGGKPCDKKRHRRSVAEIERNYLLGGYRNHVDAIGQSAFTDEALDLLTEDKLVDLVEDMKKASSSLDTLLDRLRLRLDRKAA